MGNDNQHESNRSSALSPEQLATVTAMTSAAIKEAISAVFQQIGPVMKSMDLTPEKIREMNRPYIDPAKEARQKREMLLWKQDEEERLKNERLAKERCTHLDERGQTSLRLIRNYPDRQPRGICVQCHDLIHPKEWRIAAPDAKNPRGVPYMVEPHKDYKTVLHISAHS